MTSTSSLPPRKNAASPLWVWVLPALLFVTWVGALGLHRDAIWWDEYWTMAFTGALPNQANTLIDLVRPATADPFHPPLYYLSLKAWSGLVGTSPAALRAWSVVLAALGVALAYRVGVAGGVRRAGLYAAWLLAGSALYGLYAHEMRQTMLLLVCTLALVWCYQRALLSTRRGPLLALGLSVVALLYAHYFALFVLVGIGAYHLLVARKDRRWWQISAVVIVSGLCFVPWLPIALGGTGSIVSEARLGTLDLLALLWHGLRLFGNGWLWPLLLALVIIGLGHARRWYPLVVLLASVGSILALHALRPFVTHIRYVIIALPLLYCLAALGLERIDRWRPWLGAVVLVAWLLVGAAQALNPAYVATVHGPELAAAFKLGYPVDDVARWLQRASFRDDAILFHVPQQPWAVAGAFDYYAHPIEARHIMLWRLLEDDPAAPLAPRLADFTVGVPHVWFASEVGNAPRSAETRTWLAEHYSLCTIYTVGERTVITIEEYASASIFCTTAPASAIQFGNGARLVTTEHTVGDDLAVTSIWHNAAVTADAAVGVYLLAADDALVAQTDDPLPLGPNAYLRQTIALAGVEPGRYRLALAVYDRETRARIGDQTGVTLHILATVEIED